MGGIMMQNQKHKETQTAMLRCILKVLTASVLVLMLLSLWSVKGRAAVVSEPSESKDASITLNDGNGGQDKIAVNQNETFYFQQDQQNPYGYAFYLVDDTGNSVRKTVSAFSKPGHRLVSLSGDNGNTIMPDQWVWFDGDTNLYANWERVYKITIHDNTSADRTGIVYADNVTNIYLTGDGVIWGTNGLEVDVGAFSNPGYKITGWNCSDGNHYSANDYVYFSDDVDLYAEWAPAYTVTIHDNTSANLTANLKIVKTDASFQTTDRDLYASDGGWADLSSFDNPGHVIIGWTDGNGNTYNQYETVTVSADMDLYVVWDPAYYATFHDNVPGSNDTRVLAIPQSMNSLSIGYVSATSGSPSVYYGDFVNGTKRIVEWYDNPSLSGTPVVMNQAFAVTGNMDFYAKWEDPKNIVFHSNNSKNMTWILQEVVEACAGEINAYGPTTNLDMPDNVNPGYRIIGWNTAADGSGTKYELNTMFEVTADMDLYAMWVPSYTLTFHSNTAADEKVYYEITSEAGKNSIYLTAGMVQNPYDGSTSQFYFTNSGKMITAWYDNAALSGSPIPLEQNFEVTGSRDFYAKWEDTCPVTLHSNSPANKTWTINTVGKTGISETYVMLPNNAGFVMQENLYPGYHVYGWNTKADGSGDMYYAGYLSGSAEIDVRQPMDLYAQWTKTCTLTTHADGNGDGVEEVATGEIYEKGYLVYSNRAQNFESHWPSDQTANYFYVNYIDITRKDAVITGWSTQPDGKGTIYSADPGTQIPVTGDMELYAVWSKDIVIVTYDPAYTQTGVDTEKMKVTEILFKGNPIGTGTRSGGYIYREGYTLAGYSLTKDAADYYDEGELYGKITADQNMTLYAVWCDDYFAPANPLQYDAQSHFYYSVMGNGTIGIVAYDGPDENVTVPASIAGKPVTFVGIWAYYKPAKSSTETGGTSVVSVVYPSNIPHVHLLTFQNGMSEKLKEVKFVGAVPTVRDFQFGSMEFTGLYPETWSKVPPTDFGGAKYITWVPYPVEVTQAIRVDHKNAAPDQVLVNGQPVADEDYLVRILVDENGNEYIVVELTDSFKATLPEGSVVEAVYGGVSSSAAVEPGKVVGFAVLEVGNSGSTTAVNATSSTPVVSTKKPVVLTTSGDHTRLMNVYVNGQLVGKEYYSVDGGSTIITFKPEFLATLPKDTELEVVLEFGDFSMAAVAGRARTSIILHDDPEPESSTEESSSEETTAAPETTTAAPETTKAPETTAAAESTTAEKDTTVVVTGDEARLPVWFSLLAISVLAGAAVIIARKKIH